MNKFSWRALVAVPAVLAGATLVAYGGGTASAASAAGSVSTRVIHRGSPARIRSTTTGSAALASLSTEIPRAFGPEAGSAAASLAAQARLALPSVPTTTVRRNAPQLINSFDGLNHRDQRTANGGNQFSLEPPDQGLCVGAGHVVEATNDVFQVYTTSGTDQTGVVDLNTFFGYPAEIDRATGRSGPFITDPTCLFDPTTSTFFLLVLTLDTVPETGAFTGTNHLDVAVAKNPLGSWVTYSLDVTDDGSNGSPVHPNCPCIGDYPHIGVDANGFYATTNEYSLAGNQPFNSAQVYAFSKRALARGAADVLVTQFDTTAVDRGRSGFTLWPAQSPSVTDYSLSGHGTAFFLSSNGAEEATGIPGGIPSSSIVSWSLTNTRSLDAASPDLHLHHTRVPVTTYTKPPLSQQKPGPTPLAACLNEDPCARGVFGEPDKSKPETESALDSNDTRMQQVTYAGGRLYGALDTAINVGGATQAGVAWYIVSPHSSASSLSATLFNQGELGISANNLTYPAIGVNSEGKGVIAFTLLGRDFYPSSAYAAFDGHAGPGPVYLAKAGAGPSDGFSGYSYFGSPRPRWGDYGATAVDGPNIWIASEYIGQTCTLAQYLAPPLGSCSGTRTVLANWDTRISLIRP